MSIFPMFLNIFDVVDIANIGNILEFLETIFWQLKPQHQH